MKLDDGKAWFKRWLWIGFKPITAEGKLLLNGMMGIGLLAGVLILLLQEKPVWTAVVIGISLAAIVAGYVLIYYKREDPF